MRCALSGRVCRGVCVGVLLAIIGCRTEAPYVVPEEPMPPNTVLLSQMMRELSATPGFTDALLAQLDKGGKMGPALMTPALVKKLRELILGNDWQGLDRFPGWTMQAVNPTVGVISRVATKHPETAVGTPSGAPNEAWPAATSGGQIAEYLDLGSYSREKAETVSLDKPSTLSGLSDSELVSELGAGVVRGDVGNPKLAPMHPESQRLADVLNRLGLNALEGAATVMAEVDGKTAKTPQELMQVLMATGHSVVTYDSRYFANFGHFHFKEQDVMMPFFVDSQIAIPGTNRIFGPSRSLLVPVSHAEYEWQIRGPKVNADVSWYFGIDGKAEFRTMDTLDQAWVLGRHAHEYRDAHAVEVTRLVGKMLIAYAAWQDGSLERTRSWMAGMTLRVVGAAAWVVLFGVVVWRRRRARK